MTTNNTNAIIKAVELAYKIGEPYGQTIAASELVDYLCSIVGTAQTGAILAWVMPDRHGKRVALVEFTTTGIVRECSRAQIVDMGVNDEMHGDTSTIAYRLMCGERIAA